MNLVVIPGPFAAPSRTEPGIGLIQARPGGHFSRTPTSLVRSPSSETARISKTNLRTLSETLPGTWRSKIIGRAAGANVKVLRMDEVASGEESHACDEGLLVLEGELKFGIGGEVVTVSAGEIYIVPAHTPHAVAAGSHGTLVIIDQDE
jgi:mannose-6-phosphate isomerase-like protein (cupin superfamily)